jgi:lichenan operon transcriptional antiterminator
MLTKRQIEIIKLLNDKDKLTAQNLASSLHVSTKTIRNDIHAINAMYPNSIEAM